MAVGGFESLGDHHGPDDAGRADRLARPAKRIEQSAWPLLLPGDNANGPGALPGQRWWHTAGGMLNAMTPLN
jgi:hypothetical protein